MRKQSDATAEQVASYVEQCRGNLKNDNGEPLKERATLGAFYMLIVKIPAVASVLARRGKAEK